MFMLVPTRIIYAQEQKALTLTEAIQMALSNSDQAKIAETQVTTAEAELKSIKVSMKYPDQLVLGADSVIDLNLKLINKPNSRKEAFQILKELNNSKHFLISSVCVSKNGAMIWNYTDVSELKMKNLTDEELSLYLDKIDTKTLLAYGVYQIEADGLELFEYVRGDRDSIMGLPIIEIKNYIKLYKE